MKILRTTVLVVVALSAGAMAAQSVSVDTSGSTKSQVVVQQPLKKQVVVPKPKTNWSKLKELFM